MAEWVPRPPNARFEFGNRCARRIHKQGNPLDRAADAEFAHAGLERGALHAEQRGGAFGAGDAPLGVLERTENVLALGFL